MRRRTFEAFAVRDRPRDFMRESSDPNAATRKETLAHAQRKGETYRTGGVEERTRGMGMGRVSKEARPFFNSLTPRRARAVEPCARG